MALDDIVNSTISLSVAGISQASFGYPLILSEDVSSSAPEWVNQSGWAAAMSSSGYPTTGPAYLASQAVFAQSPSPKKILLGKLNAGDATTSLNNIVAQENSWFALVLASTASAANLLTMQTASAAWVESNKKIYICDSDRLGIVTASYAIDSSSIANKVNSLSYTATCVLYHENATSSFPAAAWAGKCLPQGVSTNWALKTLTGQDYSVLSSTYQTNAFAKRANTYQRVANTLNVTQNGTTGNANGYIDQRIKILYLENLVQTTVFNILASSNAIPFSNAGISLIIGGIKSALKTCEKNGVIMEWDTRPNETTGYAGDNIVFPTQEEVTTAMKNARNLSGVSFQCRINTPMNSVTYVGTLSL